MRIAYLVNRYPAVSHSFIRREILALERAGYPVLRIALRGWADEQRGAADQAELGRTRHVLRAGAVPLLRAFAGMLVKRPLRVFKALQMVWRIGRHAERPLPVHLIYLLEACQIARWLETERITHLHAHFGTNSAEVAMLVHELGGPPFSFTVHGPEEFDKPAFIALPDKIRHAKAVMAVSSFGKSQLMRLTAYVDWHKLHVVHCGLEPGFHLGAPVTPPARSRLVCVGRLCEQKGQLILIEAMQQLRRRGVAFDLVLAGDGEMRGDIERLVAETGLTASVRVTGWISSDQVREEILAARALVLPSFAEGLPVVIMEAMALQRPVISTFVAGIPELVRPGEHGWLVPAGDADALANAIEGCLAKSDDEIARLGAAAHRQVLARHDIDVEVRKLLPLFSGERPGQSTADGAPVTFR